MTSTSTLQKACSTSDRVVDVVADLKRQLTSDSSPSPSPNSHSPNSPSPKLLVFFASSRHPLGELGAALQAAFGDVPTIGCTTAGELVSGEMLRNSVVAMLFDSRHLKDARVARVPNVRDPDGVRDALRSFGEHFGTRAAEMDPRRFVGLVLMDGMSGGEERVMAALGDATNVAFVGGSAGDDLAFKETFVFAGGHAIAGGAALALLEPVGRFEVLKTQSFKDLGKRLVVTKADEATRTVLEFDGKPAALAYAEALGVPVADLPKRFLKHPLGLMIHGEPFVRSAHQLDGNAIIFFCQVTEGMELALLEAGDIVADTKKALDAKLAEMGGASGLINFHCILRTLELHGQHQCEPYGRVFSGTPMIGFSTYGEAYIGHMNQTSTMLLFK